MTEDTTPEARLNRTGRRAESRRLRKTGAVMAAIPAAFGTTAMVIGATTGVAGAATLTVTKLADTNDGTCDSDCSLREALDDAVDGDTIIFQSGLTGTIELGSELAVADSITIQGPGADVITVDGKDAARIFNVSIAGGASGDLTISGLTLTRGAASGGAAINNANENIVIDGVHFTNNTSSGHGGAILSTNGADNDLTVTGSTFTANRAAGNGGAIDFADGALRITGGTFSGNTASDNGGAVAATTTSGSVTITGSPSFTGNYAGDGGGALYFDEIGGDVKIASTTISANSSEAKGGGLYVGSVSGDVTISDSDLSANRATDNGSGGALLRDIDGALEITGTTVVHNTANNYGGGLYIDGIGGDTTISFSTIADNTATIGSGGGIEMFDTVGALLIENSTVSGNAAGHRGGGMYLTGISGGTRIVNSTISGNRAGFEGGGITFNDYYGLTIVQSTITGNSATTFGGIYLTSDEEQSVGSAEGHGARAGSGEVDGAAERGDPGIVTLSGTIVAGNAGTDIGRIGTVTATGSLLGTLSGTALVDGGGNLQGVSPLLGPLQDNGGPTRTHALLDGSPAINAGPNPLTPFPGSADDQRGPGYARVVGGQVDIGAFEVQPTDIEPNFTG